MKKLLNVVESLLIIGLILYVLVYGVKTDIDVIVNDVTPERTDFPLSSIVFVEAAAGWSGSAILIDEDTLLTAGHIVNGCLGINIRPDDESDYYAVADGFYVYPFDAAIIHSKSKLTNTPIRIGKSSNLKIGETVYIIGYPFGVSTDIVTKGTVSGKGERYGGFFGDIDLITVDAPSWPGNSGGAVINDAGELVGILVGSIRNYDSHSIVIPIDSLNLKETLNETKL